MDVQELKQYWLELSDYDLETAQAMLDTKRYLYVGAIMDKTDVLRIARHFVVAAKDTLPVSNAWLYGSWVYGNPEPTSDIDIALELDREPRNVLQQEKQLQKLRRSLDLLMVEPIIIDSAHDRSGFSKMIVEKGERILP